MEVPTKNLLIKYSGCLDPIIKGGIKVIYIIFGASGSGKTTLLISVKAHLGERSINRKATTRNIRSYDDMEVISYPDGIPKDEYEYFYSQYGHEYAIDKQQLEDAIKGGYHHFVICNDIPTIEKIKADFKFNVKVIYLEFDAPEESIREIQKRRAITDDEINLRISKIEYLRKVFFDNMNNGLFDGVIINRYGQTTEVDLWQQVESIIGARQGVTSFEMVQKTIDYLVELIDRRENTLVSEADFVVKDFLFIIMAMQQQDTEGNKNVGRYNDDLFSIQTSIKAVASDCNMRAELANNNYRGDTMILTKIVENIKKAEIIVADLSYERPNCYFELGYAMAMGKRIIITAKKDTHIHFDVSGYDILYYNNGQDLYSKLKTTLLNR